MTGHELNPATLFRLYVDYGRYPEATELLVEYVEDYALVVGFLLPSIVFIRLASNFHDFMRSSCDPIHSIV